MYNAYVLQRTMNNYEEIKKKLESASLDFIVDAGNLRVDVSFIKIYEFAEIVVQHLNAPYNYVDVQFPIEKKTVLIFIGKTAIVSNPEENLEVKKWAIANGLPRKEADWKTSF